MVAFFGTFVPIIVSVLTALHTPEMQQALPSLALLPISFFIFHRYKSKSSENSFSHISEKLSLEGVLLETALVHDIKKAKSPPFADKNQQCEPDIAVTVTKKLIRGILTEQRCHDDFSPTITLDGKMAAVLLSYGFSDISFLYPVYRDSFLCEVLQSCCSDKVKNSFGRIGKVYKMTTRNEAGSIVHGSSTTGALVSAYTSSLGIPLMDIAVRRMVQDRQPVVIHIAALFIDSDLSVRADYTNVINSSHTGAVMISAATVQEVYDMALIAHIVSFRARIPVLHFFDGVHTATKAASIKVVPVGDLSGFMANGEVDSFRALEMFHAPSLDSDDVTKCVFRVIQQVGHVLGRHYDLFEYTGDPGAEYVVIVLSAISTTFIEVVSNFLDKELKVGVLSVRLFRPWSHNHMLEKLPKTTKRIAVLENGGSIGPLFSDVATSFHTGNITINRSLPLMLRCRLEGTGSITPRIAASVFENLLSVNPRVNFTVSDMEEISEQFNAIPEEVFQGILWLPENDEKSESISLTTAFIGNSGKVNMHASATVDLHGVQCIDYRFCSSSVVLPTSAYSVQHADMVGCADIKFLCKYPVLENLKEGGTLVIVTSEQDFETTLPVNVKLKIATRRLRLVVITDVKALVLAEALFASLLRHLDPIIHEHLGGYIVVNSIIESLTAGASIVDEVIDIPSSWLHAVSLEDHIEEAIFPHVGALCHLKKADIIEKGNTKHSPCHEVIWRLIFSNAYECSPSLRPDHQETFLVRVTENRRLTSDSYYRNIFHLEMDISGSGLTYNIGDALGVYGHNRKTDVDDFLKMYDISPYSIVSFPAGRAYGNTMKQIRTAEQLFTQVLDIFGRPSKRFYESLAEYASDSLERERLLYLISPEGKDEFKKRVDNTVTYVDVLREFPSARPSVEDLVRIVPDIKPRHYSIASSMNAHPDTVHLLVVLVKWEDNSGRQRYGQCSKYLADLRSQGDDYVTVSVKQSVMTLPPLNTTPVIMAGLGTGIAPFRAFIQERAWLRDRGVDVGPMSLYFGSRHRAQEYLYGEELEAYLEDGILTSLNLAFSRDQKEKVYIQDKMTENSALVYDQLLCNSGYFYLCGPTWPASDVKDSILNAFQVHGTLSEEEAFEKLDDLKAAERYILEVY